VAEVIVGLADLLDQLDEAIRELTEVLEHNGLEAAGRAVDALQATVRAVNQLLPRELKKPKSAFRRLQDHAQYVRIYFDRLNAAYVRSNLASLHSDKVRLRAELAPFAFDSAGEMPMNLEELPSGPAKKSISEAVVNYEAGTYSSAIVSAINALESYLRELRFERLHTDRGRGRLVDVIGDLEDAKVLSGAESPLAHVLRLYRNYSAHPSEFAADKADARMVLQFVFAKLKSSCQSVGS
jgi:HEPN domain-containing protein